jgi:hypothetical protein
MASVRTATIQAFPESMRRSRGNEGDSTYLTVTSAGAGVVCGYRPMPSTIEYHTALVQSRA